MSQFITIPEQLIKKYDSVSPRYTSYPPAPYFRDDFTQRDYSELSAESNQTLLPRDLSVYVHIPFCHSLCYFCACNKVITQPNNSKANNYFVALLKEIELRSRLFDDDRRVKQIHFGGGTPNFFSSEQLSEILDCIATHFHLDLPARLEIGIEIDPRYANAQSILDLADIGFNRFSIGVQDFSEEVQHAVNRVQSKPATLDTIAAALSVSKSVNVDLITGLPKQTSASFKQTLDSIINSGVSRIAAYSFAYLPERIKAQKMIDQEALPDDAARLHLNQTTREILCAAEYQHIGMDHYALEHDDLALALTNDTLQRNFQGYTTHAGTDLVGVGLSAISHFQNGYAQNVSELSAYQQRIKELELPIAKGIKLNHDDRLRAAMIQQIMCRSEIDLEQKTSRYIETTSRQTLQHYFAKELAKLQPLIDDGLLSSVDSRLEISPLGRYFMRQIATTFDNCADIHTPNAHKIVQFSRTL